MCVHNHDDIRSKNQIDPLSLHASKLHIVQWLTTKNKSLSEIQLYR